MTLLELNWLQTGLLILLPALVLAVALWFGRYPGEELLVRAAKPRRPRRRRCVLRMRAAPVRRIGGGLLVGSALAGRAPPADLSCHAS